MRTVILLSAFVAASTALFVCPPNACDGIKQPLLSCNGGTIRGFCGCTHSCAKVEGEACIPLNPLLLGVPNTDQCDEDLECKTALHGASVCVKRDEDFSKRSEEIYGSKRSNFMVCPENVCDNVEKKELNCVGGVLKNAGYCGCTDVCAKVEGEACSPLNLFLMGLPNSVQCDEDLECKTALHGASVCVKRDEDFSKRSEEIYGSKRSDDEIYGSKRSDDEIYGSKRSDDEIYGSKRSNGIFCPDDACDKVEKKELNCAGGVIKEIGFCGCTDVCAKVKGEPCQIRNPFLMDFPMTKICDKGLVCKDLAGTNHFTGTCIVDETQA